MNEAAFVATMLDHPHEWGPRLVFADWLEEQGDPRAELVVLLHELTRPAVKNRVRKEARLRNLLQQGVAPVSPIVRNSLGTEFVLVPPGHFLMGSPADEPGRDDDEQQHAVTLTRGFLIGRYPVTQEQWTKVLTANPSHFHHAENLPAESVNRTMALEFLKQLSRLERKPHRLATEAEWEFACRAGISAPFHFGAAMQTAQANYNGISRNRRKRPDVYREHTSPVGSFPPNGWGLYDMHGNVWEWTADSYSRFSGKAKTDPLVVNKNRTYVLRGGSWWNERARARSAARHHLGAEATGSAVGLRVCLEIEE